MNPRHLQNNEELFNYLAWLSEELKSKNQSYIAEKVRVASRFVVGSPSEFFHEAQVVLKEIRSSCASILSKTQISDITSVIDQIEIAFKRVGGA